MWIEQTNDSKSSRAESESYLGSRSPRDSNEKPSQAWEADEKEKEPKETRDSREIRDSIKKDAKQQQNAVFPDSSMMKAQLREQLVAKQYKVSDYYHTNGFSQWMAKSTRFEYVTFAVIFFNAIWIGVDTDLNHSAILMNAKPVFQIVEHVFCTYFSYEWSLRFLAFRRKRDAFKDAWFAFDSALVVSVVFETWVMSGIVLLSGGGADIGSPSMLRMARLLRLSRMARMVRLFRAMPELLILIKGMLASARSVLFTLCLLMAFIYVFAIVFTQLCDGHPCEDVFPTVASSMHTLWLNGALMDDIQYLIKPLEQTNLAFLALFYCFLLLAALTLMNMLIGVICEVVSAVSATEKESLTLTFVRDKIKELMMHGDKNEDTKISKQEFMELLGNPQAAAILRDVGVDVVGLVDFADTIFEKEPQHGWDENDEDDAQEIHLSFAEFMNVILDLRGSNTAMVKDIVELRKHMNARFLQIEKFMIKEAHPEKQVQRSRSIPLVHPNASDARFTDEASKARGSLVSPPLTLQPVSEEAAGSCCQFSCHSGMCSPITPSTVCDASAFVFSRGVRGSCAAGQASPGTCAGDQSAPGFQKLLDESIGQLLFAHEREVASLMAEICRLKEPSSLHSVQLHHQHKQPLPHQQLLQHQLLQQQQLNHQHPPHSQHPQPQQQAGSAEVYVATQVGQGSLELYVAIPGMPNSDGMSGAATRSLGPNGSEQLRPQEMTGVLPAAEEEPPSSPSRQMSKASAMSRPFSGGVDQNDR